MSHIQTVRGPIDPSVVTRIMHHEHLLSLTPGPWLSGGRPGARVTTDELDFTASPGDHDYARDQVNVAVRALSSMRELGVNLVVDLSPYGVVGRDEQGDNVSLLAEISERSGVHIVAGTAVYLEKFSPTWTRELTIEQMTARFINDAKTGIGSTRITAGIFGEQATSLGEITAHEEKCLRAAARAAKETGLALTTHTTHGTMALEQIAIIRAEGLPLNRVVVGHQDTHQETTKGSHLDYVLSVAGTGANLAIDTIGKQTWDIFTQPADAHPNDGHFRKDAYHKSDSTRAELLIELLRRGHEDQILLSQDLTGAEVYMNPRTHGQWGLGYLAASFLTLASEAKSGGGVSPAQVTKMLRTNPLRLLTIASS
ncbi:MAG: phosphotriesterase family protein [Microbacterium sp.]